MRKPPLYEIHLKDIFQLLYDKVIQFTCPLGNLGKLFLKMTSIKFVECTFNKSIFHYDLIQKFPITLT